MDQLRVVHNRVASTEVGVLLSEAVEAVGTECQDALKPVFMEGLDIHPSLDLVKILMSDSARRVTCAALLFSQNAERDPRFAKNLHEAAGDFLIARFESRRAADPEQVLHGFAGFFDFSHGSHGQTLAHSSRLDGCWFHGFPRF
jgi:hypothetical protein